PSALPSISQPASWVTTCDGTASGDDYPYATAVAPDGATVFVTGESKGSHGVDFTTVAFDAVTGHRRWVARYDGPSHGDDRGTALAATPDSSMVVVTGYSTSATRHDYTTIAYSVATGTRQWLSRFDGPGHYDDAATGLVISPSGGSVYVTGNS